MLLAGATASASAQDATRVPNATITFEEGTESVRIATGGKDGYEFSIDWGNGQEETYSEQQWITADLKGSTIKIYGDSITTVRANSQNVVSADVSNAPTLQTIFFTGNPKMTTLTLGQHEYLTGIYAYECAITSIDLTGCPAMRSIDMHINAIAGEVDLSGMSNLSGVDMADNAITSVKLPKSSTVYDLDFGNNKLTSIDVTNLDGLDELNITGNQLTSIDLSGLTAMTTLRVGENKLTEIDLWDCESLETLVASENELTEIDLGVAPYLTGVYLQNNKIAELNLLDNPAIRWLNVENNLFTSIDVSAQTSMMILTISRNQIAEIDLSNNRSINSLNVDHNQLTSIDVSGISYLSQFHCESNKIEELDLSSNLYLYGLFCGDNALTTLDLTNNTYLQRVQAQNNKLTALDLAANTGLQELQVQGNLMDAAAINAMIETLPDVSGVQVTENTAEFCRQLNISDMPGTPDANTEAAEAKGWFVTAETGPTDGITDIAADSDAAVVSTTYYNAAGAASTRPFQGFNIRVDRLDNGTTRTSKLSVVR